MDREIKFRGKLLGGGDWVYGYVLPGGVFSTGCGDNALTIVYFGKNGYTSKEVAPATVGQFTGLKDKNGVEIYEGDIVFGRKDMPWHIITITGRVVWEDAKFVIRDDGGSLPSVFDLGEFDKYEVVGNIHEPGKEVSAE